MHDPVFRAYRTNIPKVYALVYSLVALPMVYYGLNYIDLVNKHIPVTIPLLGLVMVLSLVGAYAVQLWCNRRILAYLRGPQGSSADRTDLKRSAYLYPLFLVGVMVFGWVVLLNLLVLLPVYFFFSSTLSDLIISNLLVFSCGLMSAPMTYFISEKTAGAFLSLEEIRTAPEPQRTLRLSLTVKTLAVCLIIIVTLILNTTAAMLLSVACQLSQAATLTNLTIISVLGVIDAVVISLLFARSLKLPIAHLCAGTELAKSGDLSASIPCLSHDELGDSSSFFNLFVHKLADTIRDVKTSVANTSENGRDLQQAMQDTDLSVGEIHRFSKEVQDSIANQGSIVDEVTATIQQIARTIENQDHRINEQSTSVVESSSAIEEMIANIRSISGNLNNSSREFEGLQTAIAAGNKNVDDLRANVLVLAQQSDSVYEANTIIKNIASQTNLLAMNAAIEAAHAGDAGRGFAVVADEIRKLAEVSNQQSRLISNSLKVLKQTIEQAVTMTGNTDQSFGAIISSVKAVSGLEQEIKHAMDEQSSGGNQILKALSRMNEITAEVHNGSNEMLIGSNMILGEVTNLLGITHQVRNSALSVVEKAQTVKANTGRAVALLSQNTENMQNIDRKLGYFTVD